MPRGIPRNPKYSRSAAIKRHAAAAESTDDGAADKPARKRAPTAVCGDAGPMENIQSFPYTNAEVDTDPDDEDADVVPAAVEVVPSSVATTNVVSLAKLHAELKEKLHRAHDDDRLWETQYERDELCKILFDDYFGGKLNVAEPRKTPTLLHAAYFAKPLVVIVAQELMINISDDATFATAPLLSIGKDVDTNLDKPLKDRMKLILAAQEWPEHLANLLGDLDYFVTNYCALAVREKLYADSGLETPSPAKLEARWVKGTKPGQAPMRHFVDNYFSKNKDGIVTDDMNVTLDFSISSRGASTPVVVCDAVGDNIESPCTLPGALGRGDRVVPALMLRGINLLPMSQRIGPNVRAVRLWAKKKVSSGEVDDEVDFSHFVQG